MKRVLLILLTFLIFNCKEDSKSELKNQNSSLNIENNAKELEVIVSFKTNKADEFKFMLNNIQVDDFQKKNIHVIEKIEPNTSFDMITAKFGKGNMSKNFNINFGNKEPKEIEISSIDFTYGTNTISIKGTQLNNYFSINKFVKHDSITGKLITQYIEGKHYPAMTLNRSVINTLTKKE
jgi:hypothetical protein